MRLYVIFRLLVYGSGLAHQFRSDDIYPSFPCIEMIVRIIGQMAIYTQPCSFTHSSSRSVDDD